MKQALILLIVAIVLSNSAYAQIQVQDRFYERLMASEEPVADTDTFLTTAFRVYNMDYAGAFIRLSGASPDVKVYIQQSYKQDGPFARVATNSEFAHIDSTTPFIENIPLKFMGWARFEIVGQAGNGADTKVDFLMARDTKAR